MKYCMGVDICILHFQFMHCIKFLTVQFNKNQTTDWFNVTPTMTATLAHHGRPLLTSKHT